MYLDSYVSLPTGRPFLLHVVIASAFSVLPNSGILQNQNDSPFLLIIIIACIKIFELSFLCASVHIFLSEKSASFISQMSSFFH